MNMIIFISMQKEGGWNKSTLNKYPFIPIKEHNNFIQLH